MPLDLEPLLKGFPGRVGVHARHLDRGETFSYHGDDVLPTASAAKVFVLMAYAQQCVEGKLDPDTRRTLKTEDLVHGSGVLRFCRPGLAPTLSDLAYLMMTVSDNLATNLLLDVVGGPATVNRMLRELGLGGAEVLGPIQFEKHEIHFARSTPRALADAYAVLAEPAGYGYPAAAASLCLDVLRRNEHLHGLPRYLPWSQHAIDFGVELPLTIYGKTGSMLRIQTDAGLFVTPTSRWVIAILCAEFDDPRSGPAGVASTLHAEVGRSVYEAWK
jgi:beta-lactamase class A